jgi:RND family efflux transporter MFP subunit
MNDHNDPVLLGHPPAAPQRHGRVKLVALCALAVAVAIATIGIVRRESRQSDMKQWTADQAIPSVKLVKPQKGVTNQELILPADIQAFYEAPIYARVSGYVKMWYQDIGAHVKAGQLLAEIDTPDLDQQLAQAKADLGTAKANEALAVLTAKRWQALLTSNSVSQQSTDEKLGDAEARKAQVAAAEANVQRLNALEGFKRIVAPFDGIVTGRRTDVGALIDVGSGSGPELFAVADTHQMRVYVRVPQALSAGLKVGMKAKLKLPQYPDRLFTARLDTTSNAVAADSRTVLVEFLADNADGTLWPGTFAEAHTDLPSDPNALSLPTSALLFRQNGLEVATLDGNDKVVLKSIVPGRDLGTRIEVKSGIDPDDRVVDSPPDSLADGDQLRVDTGNADATGDKE